MGVIKTVCPECGEEFNVFDVRGRKPSIPQADLRKLVERMESLPNATQQTLEWAEEIRKVLDGRGE